MNVTLEKKSLSIQFAFQVLGIFAISVIVGVGLGSIRGPLGMLIGVMLGPLLGGGICYLLQSYRIRVESNRRAENSSQHPMMMHSNPFCERKKCQEERQMNNEEETSQPQSQSNISEASEATQASLWERMPQGLQFGNSGEYIGGIKEGVKKVLGIRSSVTQPQAPEISPLLYNTLEVPEATQASGLARVQLGLSFGNPMKYVRGIRDRVKDAIGALGIRLSATQQQTAEVPALLSSPMAAHETQPTDNIATEKADVSESTQALLNTAGVYKVDTKMYFLVRILGQENILWLSEKGLPLVGGLLEYGEVWLPWEIYGAQCEKDHMAFLFAFIYTNILLKAVEEGEVGKVQIILKALPQKSLYRYLLYKDFEKNNVLYVATSTASQSLAYRYDDRQDRAKILTLLLEAIPLRDRVFLLERLEYGFFLAWKKKSVISLVMSVLTKEERHALLGHPHPLWKDIPIMAFRDQESLEGLLENCSTEQIMQYLTHKNDLGRTAFMEFILSGGRVAGIIKYLMSLISKEQQNDLLACHEQGKKIMWLAQADGQEYMAYVLSKYGIPQVIQKVSQEEKEAIVDYWQTISLEDEKVFFAQLKKEMELGEKDSLELDLRTIEGVDAVVAKWERMCIGEREIMLSALEGYGMPIPKGQVRYKTVIETIQRWAVTEALEKQGIYASESETLESLWSKLEIIKENPTEKEARERMQEEKRQAVEAFQEQFGKHPAEVLNITKEQWENRRERTKAYHKMMQQWHPDKNHGDKCAEEKSKLVIHAYKLAIEPEARRPYLKKTTLERTKAEEEMREQLETDWIETLTRGRFRKQFP